MHFEVLFTIATTLGYLAEARTEFIKARRRGFSPHLEESALLSRQSSSLCGVQNGNTSCPADTCCNQNGQCGTGRAYCDAPYCQFAFGPACDANAVPPGFNTSNVPRPRLGSILYGGAGVNNCTVPGTVALTFDDGPYIYTADLLDLLKAAGIPATFFITGNNFNKHQINNVSTPYPSIIRRMHHEGHQIASHTWSHQNLENVTHPQRIDQMIKNEIAFNDILDGFIPTYFRPPFDSCKSPSGCQSDLGALGYHIVNYNVDTHDYTDDTPALVHLSADNVSAIVDASNPKQNAFIIYAHDIYDTTVHNLTASVIATVKRKGYKFVTMGECLGDPRSNWYRNVTDGAAVVESVAFANTTRMNSSLEFLASSSSSSSSSSSDSRRRPEVETLVLQGVVFVLAVLVTVVV